MRDVIVVGGGVIGLSIAHAVAEEGKSVLVLDPGVETEAASWAAAGMLAPQSEADHMDPLFELCTASLGIYRDWAGRLREQSGIDPEYKESGLIYLAASEDSLDNLKRRMAWQREAGFESRLLSPEDVRRMEPHLTLPVVGGVLMPGEHQVTPRRLLQALRGACKAVGVDFQKGSRENFTAERVVIASGARSSGVPVAPRKGQILSLVTPEPMFHRLIRWEHAYLMQRGANELVVGATNEDAGFDRSLTPAGIGYLLAQAQQLSSCTSKLAIKEMWTGLRPATPDGLPVIGVSGRELIFATGHYRNGILLAPITASIVSALVMKRPSPIPLEPFSPARFEV